jgi:hypothetical protein
MISRTGIALALSVWIISSVVRSGSAQERDSVRARVVRPVVAVIRDSNGHRHRRHHEARAEVWRDPRDC